MPQMVILSMMFLFLPLLLEIIILSALYVLSLENSLNVKHIKLFNTVESI